jgi:hypothetical protein
MSLEMLGSNYLLMQHHIAEEYMSTRIIYCSGIASLLFGN